MTAIKEVLAKKLKLKSRLKAHQAPFKNTIIHRKYQLHGLESNRYYFVIKKFT